MIDAKSRLNLGCCEARLDQRRQGGNHRSVQRRFERAGDQCARGLVHRVGVGLGDQRATIWRHIQGKLSKRIGRREGLISVLDTITVVVLENGGVRDVAVNQGATNFVGDRHIFDACRRLAATTASSQAHQGQSTKNGRHVETRCRVDSRTWGRRVHGGIWRDRKVQLAQLQGRVAGRVGDAGPWRCSQLTVGRIGGCLIRIFCGFVADFIGRREARLQFVCRDVLCLILLSFGFCPDLGRCHLHLGRGGPIDRQFFNQLLGKSHLILDRHEVPFEAEATHKWV